MRHWQTGTHRDTREGGLHRGDIGPASRRSRMRGGWHGERTGRRRPQRAVAAKFEIPDGICREAWHDVSTANKVDAISRNAAITR